MARRIRQFIVYTKVTVVLLLLFFIVVLIVQNWSYKTRFWPGAADKDVPTLWLMLAAGLLSIVAFWIMSRMRRVFAELAELRSERARELRLGEQERRSKALDDQERRIDEKIKNALADETPTE